MLDENQSILHEKFGRSSFLSIQKNVESIIDWCTFFRKNLAILVLQYFQITLYSYQVIWLIFLDKFHSLSIIASRATAKSFVIAVFCCAKAVLYPGINIVIASATKKQARLIVTEKIEGFLMKNSNNLRREIKKVTDNGNDTKIEFWNGSSITVVVANDNARGYRSNILILEEYRQIKKTIKDEVLMPFSETYKPQFSTMPGTGYNEAEFGIRSFFAEISSSWRKNHWMWDEALNFMNDYYKNDSSSYVLAADYSLSLKHDIKSVEDIVRDKKNFDPLTFRIEYENEMLDETTNAYFTYDMLERNQKKSVKVFYPRKDIDVLSKKKNPYEIPKRDGEVRLVSNDIAFVDKNGNDRSCFLCMRLIPETIEYRANTEGGSTIRTKTGYRRIVPYLETMPGQDTFKQAVRIKQLYEDFNADYVVLDARAGGLQLYEQLARVIYDESRDKEYQPWVCMNDKSLAERIKISGAIENLFAINATLQLNSDIAIAFKEVLNSGRIEFLPTLNEVKEELEDKYPEYTSSPSAEDVAFFERPYLETQALFAEVSTLQYELKQQSGATIIRVHEQGNSTKDRYSAVSYASYFAGLLENDMFSDDGSYDFCTFVN